tara:strand:+ start:5740 stop:6312 length:573 start_codon:yes stop_codon:yes gene_type:complete
MFTKIPYEAFFALYLIIASNYLGELFSCKFRELLSSNMLIKHIIGLITFGFLVVLSGIDLDDKYVFINGILLTIFIYIWFVLSTKTHVYITIIIVVMFLVMYIISYRIKYLKEKNKSINEINELVKINKYILIITGIITIIGVIHYGYLKKRELIKRNEIFSIYNFLVGCVNCRNDNIDTLLRLNNKRLF